MDLNLNSTGESRPILRGSIQNDVVQSQENGYRYPTLYRKPGHGGHFGQILDRMTVIIKQRGRMMMMMMILRSFICK